MVRSAVEAIPVTFPLDIAQKRCRYAVIPCLGESAVVWRPTAADR